jgi:hypothetical protein
MEDHIMKLSDFVSTNDASELRNILRLPDYRSHVRTLKTGDTYCFRIHDRQNRVAGRSKAFKDKAERDSTLARFITYVEVQVNGRRQIKLF